MLWHVHLLFLEDYLELSVVLQYNCHFCYSLRYSLHHLSLYLYLFWWHLKAEDLASSTVMTEEILDDSEVVCSMLVV